MAPAPSTRSTLLLRVRDQDDATAWQQFVDIYSPLILAYCRKRGLQEADASDVVQDVLQALSDHLPRFQYDRSKGRFRGWLFSVVRSKLSDAMAKKNRQVAGSGETAVHSLLAAQPSQEETTQWNLEHQRRLFEWAAEQIRNRYKPTTWQAFWQTAVENRPTNDVSDELGLSPRSVYVAKCRILKQLKQTIAEVDGDEPDT